MEELYREWQRRGELHLGVTMMPLVENMFAAPRERLGGGSGASEGRLRVGPLKLFTDGGVACAMCIPLRDAIVQFAQMIGRSLRQRSILPWRLALQQKGRFAGGALHTGLLYYELSDLERLVADACTAGFDVGMHAAGNEAIGQALEVFARAYRATSPPRIDHFFFADEDLLRRASATGCRVVVQPIQLPEIAPMLNETGLPGTLRFQAFGAMRGAGLTLAGSSDAPVFSFDVLRAVDAAVRRRLPDGSTADPDQRLAIDAAVALYTCDAARVLGLEAEIGVLRPYARADAVVLNEPLHAIDHDHLGEVRVLATFTGTHEHRW
jgi:predicted amidohydrolase YtcJ